MANDDFPAPGEGMVLTVLLIVADQDRSRDFYRDILGAKVVLERDPCIMKVPQQLDHRQRRRRADR